MKSSKLYQVISQFSLIEQRSFRKFVRSPYHNTRSELVLFCDLLFKSVNSKDGQADSKAYYYKRLFPGAAYDDKKMRYTISFLYQQVKSFLAYEQFNRDEVNKQRLVAKAIKDKRLPKLYEKAVKKREDLLEKHQLRNAKYYLDQYLNSYDDYEEFYKRIKVKTRVGEILNNLNTSADLYFMATTLKIGCMWLSFNANSQPADSQKILEEVLARIEANMDYEKYPVIELYFNAYKMLTSDQEEAYFNKFKVLINSHGHLFELSELSELYVLAINHCIRQSNLGKTQYRQKLFELYQKGLITEVFFDHGKLNSTTYINIAQTGLLLEEYDWVKRFIEEYKSYLKVDLQEQFYLFNLANYHNKRKNYDQVMEILRTVTFAESMLELAARRMLLKIYVELEETEALYSLFDSFKNYIYRHKELGYHKNNYLNLIKYTKKLVQMKPNDPDQQQKLAIEIKNSRAIVEKNWLLERLGK